MDPYTRKELAFRAAARAEQVRLKCDVAIASPVDSLLVTEKRKCEVRFMALPSLEGVYSPPPRPVMILGSQRPAGRRAFTCAHELGHHEFMHGTRMEEIDSVRSKRQEDPEEFLADMFAAFLLMSQGSVRRAFKDRNLQPHKVEPMEVFRLACYFGVGYGTLISHLTWTLKLMSQLQREVLLQTQPRELKAEFGGAPQSEVILVDGLWQHRCVDLEIGDTLVLHPGVVVEEGPRLSAQGSMDGQPIFKAVSRGYIRAFHKQDGWAVNIRISSKHYQGLARYRFLDDPEESIQ